MNSESMCTLPCHTNIIQSKVKIFSKAAARPLRFSEARIIAFFDVAKAFDTVWIDGLFKQMYDLGITGKIWRLLYRCYVKFK